MSQRRAPPAREAASFQFWCAPVVFPACVIGNQAGGAFEQRVHDFQAVRCQRRAGFRAFDNGVDKAGDFGFGRAPAKFHLRGDAVLFQGSAW